MNYKTDYTSPIGKITLCSDDKNLVGLWFEGQKCLYAQLQENSNLEIFNITKNWLDRYFAGKRPEISELPLSPKGSEFRQAVWEILCKIPYGEVTTYGKIAEEIAHQKGITKMSAQAVGGAIGANPIAIIIPCHRVIGSNRNLTGYAGGLEIKEKLLLHEGFNGLV